MGSFPETYIDPLFFTGARVFELSARIAWTQPYNAGFHGVIINSALRYDLVKPAFSFSDGLVKTRFVGVTIISGRIEPFSFRGNEQCDRFILPFFHLCLRLRQSESHYIVNNGATSGVGRKQKRSDKCDSNSVEVLAPIKTSICTFRSVISAVAKWFQLPLRYQTPRLSILETRPFLLILHQKADKTIVVRICSKTKQQASIEWII